MHICLTPVEIFAWGKFGGFGRATRIIGRELARQGIRVTAVVPQRSGQKSEEWLDGIQVLSYPAWEFPKAYHIFKQLRADIYHSQEPSFGTWLAMKAAPASRHVVTFRDTRFFSDWLVELSLPSLNVVQVMANWLFEDNWLVHDAVRKADARYTAARMLIPKAQRKYRLDETPQFIPTPVEIPSEGSKSEEPTVCFVSRMDRRKRPERFFELARRTPQVKFIAVGKSRSRSWDAHLRRTYQALPNLEMKGFIDQFSSHQLHDILSRSWILVNTAAREGLPNSFIEAAAHGCAILSSVDPDGFASRFGYFACHDDFDEGLVALLAGHRWRSLGIAAREHVRNTFSKEQVIPLYIDLYNHLIHLAHTD